MAQNIVPHYIFLRAIRIVILKTYKPSSWPHYHKTPELFAYVVLQVKYRKDTENAH